MTPDDKQLIDAIREKANGMFGETYILLMRVADRLAELTGNAGELVTPTIREVHRTEHEPLDRWEER